MATINVAFSNGLESVAMVVKGLRDGHTLNLCVINVSNNRETYLFELYHAVKFAEHIKANTKEYGFKGYIKEIYMSPRCPWAPTNKYRRQFMRGHDESSYMVTNEITQQFATVLGMLDLRRWNILTEYPGVWIGWLKQDAVEFSYSEYDHTEADYLTLLELPKQLGRLAVADRTGTVYRAPLWELSKRQVFGMIPDALLGFVVHTGEGKIFRGEKDKIVYNVSDAKRAEWRASKMKDEMLGEHWEYKLSEIPLQYRLIAGEVRGSDVGLPPEADQMLLDLTRHFMFGILGGPIGQLDSVVHEWKSWVGCVVDAVNNHGIRFPTDEEKAAKRAEEERQQEAIASSPNVTPLKMTLTTVREDKNYLS